MTTTPEPFITFYTPAYKRPQMLARCLASVAAQTAVADVEQLVIVDHVGRGIGGMFASVPHYVDALHGLYVHMLGDDDELAAPNVVETVRAFAVANDYPQLILVSTVKGGYQWPAGEPWPPRLSRIDSACAIVRRDVWIEHAHCWGWRYEGDFDFFNALYLHGVRVACCCDLLFSTGAVSHGRPERVEAAR